MCRNPESVGPHAYRIGCAHMQETVRHTLSRWTVCSGDRIKTQWIACEPELSKKEQLQTG